MWTTFVKPVNGEVSKWCGCECYGSQSMWGGSRSTYTGRLGTTGSHSVKLPLRANMSVDGTKLLFEGFLKKRKDTMVCYKLSWYLMWVYAH